MGAVCSFGGCAVEVHGFGVLFGRVDGCCFMSRDGLWTGMLYSGSSPIGCPLFGFRGGTDYTCVTRRTCFVSSRSSY